MVFCILVQSAKIKQEKKMNSRITINKISTRLNTFKSGKYKSLYLFFTNTIITFLLMTVATIISFILFYTPNFSPSVIAPIYILTLILITTYTTGYLPGIIASVISVICINYLFTFPYFKLNFTITGYPLTFLVMLSITVIISTYMTRFKKQSIALAEKEKLIAEGEKEKIRANLLRSISHDLRTPLTSIIGASSSLTNENLNLSKSEREHLMNNITEDAAWLLNMVENILSVTKIQDDNRTLKKNPEPLEEIMSDSVLRVKRRMQNANIKITLPDEFILIPMDALLIQQVTINLLENALKHSHSKKPIELYTTVQPDTVTVYVKDYGVGIESEKKDEIFKSYTRRNNSPDQNKGMGIGLSICQTIITAHNGEIHADIHDDGSIFYFTLPKED